MEEKAVYRCIDAEHETWECRTCGYMETFEADGPAENGWRFCPGCGGEIVVEAAAVNPCPFGSTRCLCQFCEMMCNNGLNCAECRRDGKQEHEMLLCTGFVGNWGK